MGQPSPKPTLRIGQIIKGYEAVLVLFFVCQVHSEKACPILSTTSGSGLSLSIALKSRSNTESHVRLGSFKGSNLDRCMHWHIHKLTMTSSTLLNLRDSFDPVESSWRSPSSLPLCQSTVAQRRQVHMTHVTAASSCHSKQERRPSWKKSSLSKAACTVAASTYSFTCENPQGQGLQRSVLLGKQQDLAS